MNHGRGDLQAWEVLSPHGLLKVLLIVFLFAAKIKQGTDRAQTNTCKQMLVHNAVTLSLFTPFCSFLYLQSLNMSIWVHVWSVGGVNCKNGTVWGLKPIRIFENQSKSLNWLWLATVKTYNPSRGCHRRILYLCLPCIMGAKVSCHNIKEQYTSCSVSFISAHFTLPSTSFY